LSGKSISLSHPFNDLSTVLTGCRFRARNWREWKEFDEDGEFSGVSDDEQDEEDEDSDGEAKEEDRYWEGRVAQVLGKKKQEKLRWKDDGLIVTRARK
jgi:hypothetical protein